MKKRQTWLAGALAAILTMGMALTGCEGTDTPSAAATSGTAAGEQLAEEQVVYLTQPEVNTFDSAQSYNTADATIIMNTQEGLFRYRYDTKGNATQEKAACTDYQISEDGLTYTFKLRDNKWSDGKAVTAADYVFAVKRLLDPEVAAGYAFFATGLVNGEAYNQGKISDFSQVGVKAPDSKTLEFKLAAPDSAFLQKLASPVFMPIREDAVNKLGDKYGDDPQGVLFSGAFRIAEWTDKSSAKLVKNEQYWDAANVKLTAIELSFANEASTQDKLFKEGRLSQIGAQADYLETYRAMAKKGECQVIAYPSDGSVKWLSCSSVGPSGIMKSAKVRRAICAAVNSQEYCKTLYSRHTPANDLIPPAISVGGKSFTEAAGVAPWEEDIQKYRGNPKALQALLREGLQEQGKQTSDLSQYTITFLTFDSESSLGRQSQELIQQQIQKNLGIKVNLEILSGSEQYYAEIKDSEEWDMALNGWSPDYNEPMTFFDIWRIGGPSNTEVYNNPAYDQLIKDAKAEVDESKRLEIYKKCDKLLHDDAVITPFYFPDTNTFLQKNLRNVQIATIGYQWDYTRAYLVAEDT